MPEIPAVQATAQSSAVGMSQPSRRFPNPPTLALAGLGALGCVPMFWRPKS